MIWLPRTDEDAVNLWCQFSAPATATSMLLQNLSCEFIQHELAMRLPVQSFDLFRHSAAPTLANQMAGKALLPPSQIIYLLNFLDL
jgi:hypothetical protein